VQDTQIFVSERWPVLEGGARVDVTTVNDVVVYDVLTLDPYRVALAADEARCRGKCDRFLSQLEQLADALCAELPGGAFANRFSLCAPEHCAEAVQELDDALAARAAAFEGEALRIDAASKAFSSFSQLADAFSQRLACAHAEVCAAAAAAGPSCADALAAARGAWRGGADLADAWAELQEADERCAAHGVAGTRLALVRLALTPDAGYSAVRTSVDKFIEQLELEVSLIAAFQHRAGALAPWVESVSHRFDPSTPLPATLSAAQAQWSALCAFLSSERPAMARELGAVIELRQGCSAALHRHGRPGAQPLAFAGLEAAWAEMEGRVQRRAAAVGGELRRLRALGDAVQRFTHEAMELLDWLSERAAGMAAQLQAAPKSRNDARAVKALVTAYAAEWAERQADLCALRRLGCRVLAHRYERGDKVSQLFERLAEGMADASLDPSEARLAPLEAAEAAEADLKL
jgi:hypothetical protein